MAKGVPNPKDTTSATNPFVVTATGRGDQSKVNIQFTREGLRLLKAAIDRVDQIASTTDADGNGGIWSWSVPGNPNITVTLDDTINMISVSPVQLTPVARREVLKENTDV